MPRIKSLPFPVASRTISAIVVPTKQREAIYGSSDYLQWRKLVIARAHGQCEAVLPNGWRCLNGVAGRYRLFADHIVELKDGGAPFDVNNGMCLCASHHQTKTMDERRRRLTTLNRKIGGVQKN